MEEDVVARGPVHINGGLQMDDPLGQRAGFIGADDVHAAIVLDRRKAFDNHLVLRHPFGAMRKVDADDRGQQLWGQSDGECQRKEKGIKGWTCQQDVDGKDRDHQKQRDLHEEIAESPYAALKFRFLWSEF